MPCLVSIPCSDVMEQVGRQMMDANMTVVRDLAVDKQWEAKDPDHVAFLCKETVQVGGLSWV